MIGGGSCRNQSLLHVAVDITSLCKLVLCRVPQVLG